MNFTDSKKVAGAFAGLILALGTHAALAQSRRSDLPPAAGKTHVVHPIVLGPAPANDDCANATVVGALPFTDNVDTTAATTEGDEPASSCTLDGATIWYVFTNNQANPVLATADTIGSDFDTAIEAFTGTCGVGLTSVACGDDGFGDGLQSSITFVVDAGQTVRIKAGGFEGDFGAMVFHFDAVGGGCPLIQIDGTLGAGSPDFPGTSGNQTGRLNRNGIASSCDVPKTCAIFDATGSRAFDSYAVPNDSGATQCLFAQLDVDPLATCNLQVNAYLDTYVPANICTSYLADPGLSSGGDPQTATTMSFELPASADAVFVVHTTNPGETGCSYTLSIVGDLCSCSLTAPSDVAVAADANQCGAVVNFAAPTTGGSCGTVTCSPASGTFFAVGVTPVTCSGTAGGSDSFNVTVSDAQAPVLACPADVNQPAAGPTAVNFAAPTVTDNCPGAQAPSCVPASGSVFPVATTPVACSAQDAAGNGGNCGFNVTVQPGGGGGVVDVPVASPAGLAGLSILLASAALVMLRRRRSR
ncbi:MAG: HYR domain-containing protein [Thermoanaerobaculia bacterium]